MLRLVFWVVKDVDVTEYVPDVPELQGGARGAALTASPVTVAVATLQDDRGGLDRWAVDDARVVLHDPEPRRPTVWEGPRRLDARYGDGDGRCNDHSRDVPPLLRLFSRRARGGPRRQLRRQVHERRFSCLRQEHGLVPDRRLGVPQEHQRQGGTGQLRHQRHAARLRQRQQD